MHLFGGCAMPGRRPRVYWDANCFLHLINRDPRWFPTLEILLEEAAIHRTTEIVTSVLSVSEVAFAAIEKHQRAFDEKKEAEIEAFWIGNKGIILGDYSVLIAREARRLRREEMVQGWKSVKLPDLIHLATAVRMGAERIYTTEPRLHHYSTLIGIPVGVPFTAKQRLPGLDG